MEGGREEWGRTVQARGSLAQVVKRASCGLRCVGGREKLGGAGTGRYGAGTGQLTLEARRVREQGAESESQQAGEGAAGLTGFAGLQPWAAAVQGRALVCC